MDGKGQGAGRQLGEEKMKRVKDYSRQELRIRPFEENAGLSDHCESQVWKTDSGEKKDTGHE